MSHGIQGLFGPNDFILGSHVQSLCDALDIPHLEARPDIDNSYKESSLNLQPSQDIMNQAYKVIKITDILIYLNTILVCNTGEKQYLGTN